VERRVLLLVAASSVILIGTVHLLADRLEDTFYIPPDHPAIRYGQSPLDDPIARLEKRLESGQVKLEYAPNGGGYLPAVLKQLGINVDSQVLVFSKTSIQAERISPATPRAIYFNDDVAAGFVQRGDLLEFAALDSKRGVVFYTLDAQKSVRPAFTRRNDCLRCHQGPATLGVPGILVSSVHPRSEQRDSHGSSFLTDHRSPLNERWGGWYVTGTTGSQKHLGNNTALVDAIHPGEAAGDGSQDVTSLSAFFDTARYPAATSDVVALMTLEHQVRMTNLITRIGWDASIALYDRKTDDETQGKIRAEIEEMVGYMLFANEAPLQAPITGVSTFTKTFAEKGPRDGAGRSLRDFDLQTRLFKYPVSYMIYGAAFDGMPKMARDQVYQRLYDVLSGRDQDQKFARLPAADRRAALEILRDTKPNLPAYWKTPSAAQ